MMFEEYSVKFSWINIKKSGNGSNYIRRRRKKLAFGVPPNSVLNI